MMRTSLQTLNHAGKRLKVNVTIKNGQSREKGNG